MYKLIHNSTPTIIVIYANTYDSKIPFRRSLRKTVNIKIQHDEFYVVLSICEKPNSHVMITVSWSVSLCRAVITVTCVWDCPHIKDSLLLTRDMDVLNTINPRTVLYYFAGVLITRYDAI